MAYSDSLIERAEIRDPAPGTRYEIEWWLPLRLANGLYNIACVVSAPGESAPGPNFMNSDLAINDFGAVAVQFHVGGDTHLHGYVRLGELARVRCLDA